MQLKVTRNGDKLVLGTVTADTIHDIIGALVLDISPPMTTNADISSLVFFLSLSYPWPVVRSPLSRDAPRELRLSLPASVDREAGAQGSRRLRNRPLHGLLTPGHEVVLSVYMLNVVCIFRTAIGAAVAAIGRANKRLSEN